MRSFLSSRFVLRIISLAAVLVTAAGTLAALPAGAEDITQPEEFYGAVTINGLDAPAGTVITAKINGVQRGKYTTLEDGLYGGADTFDTRLVVSGQEDEINEEITFWVNGRAASQTEVFEPGVSRQADLEFQKYPLKASDTQIEQALDYLRAAQTEDGSIGGYVPSSWAVLAIAAAGEDPDDWTNGGDSLIDYLEDRAADYLDADTATDWERSILAIVAAERSPYDFGGLDYIAALTDFFDGDQMGDSDQLNDDVWGILALKSAAAGEDMIEDMAAYLLDHQNDDGGWGWGIGVDSDVDNTAATISALLAAGESADSAAVAGGIEYMQSQQQSNGGFVSQGTTNAAVDAWAIWAICDLDQSPLEDEWQINGHNPVSHLLSLQDSDGSFRWTASLQSNPEWMTAYAVTALLQASWPSDNTAPVIGGLTPASGGTVSGTSKTISASLSDSISGIEVDSALLWLDDEAVEATVTDSKISYSASGLATGTHTVKVVVSDRAGNSAEEEWSFKVTKSSGGGGGGGSSSGSTTTTTTTPTPTVTPTGTIAGVKVLSNGVRDVSSVVDSAGNFLQAAGLHSDDGACDLDIAAGVKAAGAGGNALTQITITNSSSTPEPPSNCRRLGVLYELGPSGATFEPALTLSLHYEAESLPDGAGPANLALALWDPAGQTWQELVSTVDTENQVVRASITHFSAYGLIVHTAPAAFVLDQFGVTPAVLEPGQPVTVQAVVTNQGDLRGAFELALKVDGESVETRTLELDGQAVETLSFVYTTELEGPHEVSLGEMTGTFTVNAVLSPADLQIDRVSADSAAYDCGESIRISALVNNLGDLEGSLTLTLKLNDKKVESRTVTLAGGAEEEVEFVLTQSVPGNYQASVNDLPVSFKVVESTPAVPAETESSFNWIIVLAAVAVIVVIGLVVLAARRKKRG